MKKKARVLAIVFVTLTGLAFSIAAQNLSSYSGHYVEKPYHPLKSKYHEKGDIYIGKVMFKFGSDEITINTRKALRRVANSILLHHDGYHEAYIDSNRYVKIIGFTDTSGESQYNINLGLNRARAVAATLESMGVSMQNAVIASYGESTAAGIHANYRQAEIWLSAPQTTGNMYLYAIIILFFVLLMFGFFFFIISNRNKQRYHHHWR